VDWNRFLNPIIKALDGTLQFFYGFTHDYTLAIILLTLIVKLVLHPLTRTQLRSMKGMQVIAPHMEALRRKYKDDPKALNQEMMALYRAHNLNPMMGCLPMLVQMPVFIALWRVLYDKSIFGNATAVFGIPWMRLDQAPNLGQVLSAVAAGRPEQLLLLLFPVLVGATMFFQQRMTITDPSQARMFVFMPIMMGYFATIYPIGVSIYMIVSTMAYIAEYFLVVGSPPPMSAAPPKSQAAAAASSAGGGRAPAPMPQGKKGAKRA
jgi:YidC/Oxa1 family membrane protein insertase